MSKGNMLLGHARGKVGDLVFSRTNGQQVVRSRAAVVRNPQTKLQQIQRVIMATVMRAYAATQALSNHSFEGVKPGQESMSRFMRANLNALRQRITSASEDFLDTVFSFTPLGYNVLSYNEYIMSTGSLPSVPVTINGTSMATLQLPVNTYQGVLDAYSLEAGDQLTFITFHPAADDGAVMAYTRVILSPANGDFSSTFINADGTINQPNIANEGSFVALSYADGVASYRVAGSQTGAAGIIVSRKGNDGAWKRSNTQLSVGSAAFGYSMQEALTLSSDTALYAENVRYLNNANTVRGSVYQYSADTALVGITSGAIGDATGILAVTTAGTLLPIRNGNSLSQRYGRYLSAKVADAQQAWTITQDQVNAAGFEDRVEWAEDAESIPFKAWLMEQGVPEGAFAVSEG